MQLTCDVSLLVFKQYYHKNNSLCRSCSSFVELLCTVVAESTREGQYMMLVDERTWMSKITTIDTNLLKAPDTAFKLVIT